MRLGLVAAALTLASCAVGAPTPAQPPAAPVTRVLAAPADPSNAVAVVARAIQKGDLDPYETTVAELGQSGLSEQTLVTALETFFGDCLASRAECTPRQADGEFAVLLLGQYRSDEAATLLYRLQARGVTTATRALSMLLDARFASAVGSARCEPPSETEVAAMQATPDDFAVIDVRDGQATGRQPSPRERSDLAYLLVAVSGSGSRVGAPQPLEAPITKKEIQHRQQLLRETLERATYDGPSEVVRVD